MENPETSSSDRVCTTQRAAELLGLSITSVQQLVETGELEAWKTKGGHRRIPVEAIYRFKGKKKQEAPLASGRSGGNVTTTVLVIEDSKMQQAVYARHFDSWALPVNLQFCDNGYQALMAIARNRPDIVLADIVMEGIDGYEVIRTVLADPDLSTSHIAIISSLGDADLAQRGGVPPGVARFAKPVSYDELRGYVKACIAHSQRTNTSL